MKISDKKAFSMVELLLLLLFVSLITAALTPVVTRKHFKIPKPMNHGAYICYTALDGTTHEVRYSGKALNMEVFADRAVSRCNFEPPKKVSYFHVSAIGGGGGGGDSGYDGGTYITLGPYTEQLSPLNITESMINENQRDMTDGDITNFFGELYGYVHGAASGKGGDQNYVTRHDSYPCTTSHNETYTTLHTSWHTSTTCTETEEVTECPEGGCGSTNSSSDSDSDSSTIDSESDEKTDWSEPSQTCSPDTTRCKKTERKCVTKYKTVGATPNGAHINCHNPGECAQNGSVMVTIPYDDCSDECVEEETLKGNCSYNKQDSKFKLKLPNFKYYQQDTNFAYLHPKLAYLNNFKLKAPMENLLSYTVCKTWDTVTTSSTYTSSSTKNVCDEHRDYYSYSTSAFSGGAGAVGATCRTGIIHGGTNISLSADSLPNDGSNGASCYNGSPFPSEYDSPSHDAKVCIPCPAENGNAVSGGSTITFGGSSVTAQNAISGGTGATCDADGIAGTDGTTCSGGTTVTEGCSPGRYGYCLKRHHRSTWEANATYEFKFTFSQNYLQYGEAGMQGQYRTMIIRSFKQDSIPITLGSGGAPGVDGGQGESGSSTVFGNIITAKGGEGGLGGFMTPPEVLEGYRTGAENWSAGVVNGGYSSNHRVVRREVGKDPQKPKPDNLSSNILNFLVPMDNEKISNILDNNRVGYGGKGGGSQHNCWFGEYKKWLDEYTVGSTTYGELEHSYGTPAQACVDMHEKIEPESGHGGAVIIRW